MVAPLVVAAGFLFMLGSQSSPFQRFLTHNLNTVFPTEILDPASLIEAEAFGEITDDTFKSEMKKHGFDRRRTNDLRIITQTKLNSSDLIQLRRRGLISESDFRSQQKMSRTGDKIIAQIEDLSKYVPGVQDTIQFAVREAYRDDIAGKFGYDEDFPTADRIKAIEDMNPDQYDNLAGSDRLIAQALQIGLDPDILRRFWRSHWQLPSITAGLEMFHRLRPEFNPDNPVDFETIKELLKIQDIAPFWQERILETSFNLPTRVDVRRMYRAGSIDIQTVYDTYRDLGYDDVNATLLTEWTEVEYAPEQKDLTRSQIERAYADGLVTEPEANDLLNVPMIKSTSSFTPRWIAVPLPPPKTPTECASSTISRAPYFLQTGTISDSGAMSPPMLKTPSTTTRLPQCPGIPDSTRSKSATSLCRNLFILPKERRQPSTMLA